MIDWDEIYTLKPHFPIFTAKKQRKTSDYEQEKVITNRRIDSIFACCFDATPKIHNLINENHDKPASENKFFQTTQNV